MERARILIICLFGFFAILASIAGGCTSTQMRIEKIIDEYLIAHPSMPEAPMREELDPTDLPEFAKYTKGVREEWSKAMNPYATKILHMGSKTAAVMAEILRESWTQAWQMWVDAEKSGISDVCEYFSSNEFNTLCSLQAFAVYVLEQMGDSGVEVLVKLLSDEYAGMHVGISLGNMGQKIVLKEYFRNKDATDVGRLNAALGLTCFFADEEPVPFLRKMMTKYAYATVVNVDSYDDLTDHFMLMSAEMALQAVGKDYNKLKQRKDRDK